MPPSPARFTLLTRLAWELRAIPASSLLTFPYYGEPVLYVPRICGRRDAVLAVQRQGHWLLLWRDLELPADPLPLAAARIAATAMTTPKTGRP